MCLAVVDSAQINSNLRRLDTEYNRTIEEDPELPLFYSKLAVIEFGGWLEESFDEILLNYIDSHIVNSNCHSIIAKLIRRNYGFKFEDNIYKIFSIVIGANNWENIIDVLQQGANFSNLESILNQYSESRNKMAHTYSKNMMTPHYKAPSQVISDFNKILPAIQEIEEEVQRL